MDKFYEHVREDGLIEYRNENYDTLMAKIAEEKNRTDIPADAVIPTAEDDLNVILMNRKYAYPPIEDFADAWVKQDEDALEEYRQKCLAVKAAYPKPGDN